MNSEKLNSNVGLSVNVVNSLKLMKRDKEKQLDECTNEAKIFYIVTDDSEKEINESDVNYKSTEQYNLFSIGSVEKDRKNNFKLFDFKVKANGYYNYWDERKEEDVLDKNKEEQNMLVMRKEPKSPWEI